MEFFALVIVIILLQYWGSGGPVQHDDWFQRWSARLQSWQPLADWPGARFALQVGLPLLGVGLVFAGVQGWLWGLVGLVLAVVVLLYSLGRGDLSARLAEYLHHWQAGDTQSAWHHARLFVLPSDPDEPDSPEALHAHVRRALLYQGFERLFAVMFWFVVLGPVGALAYRLARLTEEAGDDAGYAERLVAILEWIPVRLLALTFALTGNFGSAVLAAEGRVFDAGVPAVDCLEDTGLAALELPATVSAVDWRNAIERDAFLQRSGEALSGLQALLSRSAMLWLAVVAVLQLI